VAEVRVALVAVPPFLADLIRRVVATRAGTARLIIEEIGDSGESPSGLPPAIVILGPAAAAPWVGPPLPPAARVLSLSPDLTRLLGPGQGDSAPLTPDVLAERLSDIAQSI
jgi:hypothetical protein